MATVVMMHLVMVFSGSVDREVPVFKVKSLLDCVKACSAEKICSSLFYDKQKRLCAVARKEYCQDDLLLSSSKAITYFSQEKDFCTMKWIPILKTSKLGKVTYGRMVDLQSYVDQGRKIRFLARANKNVATGEFDNCKTTKNELCCQSLLDIDTTSKTSAWRRHTLCTTGHWNIMKHSADCRYPTIFRVQAPVVWFALRTKTGTFQKAVYSVSSKARKKTGDVNSLIRYILKGMEPTVIVQQMNILFIQSVQVHAENGPSPDLVSADNIWSISQKPFGNHYEFKRFPYWYFQNLTSSGKALISKRDFKCGSHARHERKIKDVSWFINSGWVQLNTGRGDGSEIKELMEYIKAGHAIRVKFGNTVVNANNIVITDHVFVQTLSGYRAKQRHSEVDFNFIVRTIESRGTVKTYLPSGKSSLNSLPQTSIMDTTWFVDTKKWMKLFHIMENGTVLKGSALSVREVVTNGGEIRTGVRMPGNTVFRYFKVDNIHIQRSPNVQATVAVALKDHILNNEYKLDSIRQWSFKVISTKGYVKTSELAAGQAQKSPWKKERAEMIWFAFA